MDDRRYIACAKTTFGPPTITLLRVPIFLLCGTPMYQEKYSTSFPYSSAFHKDMDDSFESVSS
jgi:hypothetical protein